MKLKRYLLLAGFTVALAGCALLASPMTPAGHASLSLQPQVQGGSYHTQTTVGAYTQTDIRHLQVRLFKVVGGSEQAILGSGGSPLMLDLPQASLSVPITFANLNSNTTYRVRAYAYADAGTSTLISTTDSGSYVDVAVTTDDRPTVAMLPVRLLDRLFNGQASSSIVFSGGGGQTSSGTMSLGFHISAIATLVGGAGATGSVDGIGTAARFTATGAMKFDGHGNLYTVDIQANTVRKIVIATGEVTTVAGTPDASGSTDGIGSEATFNQPTGLALDGAGNAYVAERQNHTIRKIVLASGAVSTLAGKAGIPGSADGTGTDATFDSPTSIISDGLGNLYVADFNNHSVRKIVIATGAVTTVIDNFGLPTSLVADGSGNLYVALPASDAIYKVVLATGEASLFAGTEASVGSADGVGSAARFNMPVSIVADGKGNLYVADTYNHTIRKIVIATAAVSTILGQAGTPGAVDAPGSAARLNYPTGMAFDDAGYLYVSDSGNATVRKIAP